VDYIIRHEDSRYALCKVWKTSRITESKTMVFVGDPFTFGAGLNDSETLAAFLCKTYKVSSVNLGISNYSTNHSLFPMQEFHNERPRSERESFCG